MIINFENVTQLMRHDDLDGFTVFAKKDLRGETAYNFLENYRRHLKAKYPNNAEEQVIYYYDTHKDGVYSLDEEMKSIRKLSTSYQRASKLFVDDQDRLNLLKASLATETDLEKVIDSIAILVSRINGSEEDAKLVADCGVDIGQISDAFKAMIGARKELIKFNDLFA